MYIIYALFYTHSLYTAVQTVRYRVTKRINKNKGCDSLLYSGIGMDPCSDSQSPSVRVARVFELKKKSKQKIRYARNALVCVTRGCQICRFLICLACSAYDMRVERE